MSIAAIFAPRSLRARIAWVITLTWVFTGLVPQITTRSDTRHLARIDAGDLAGADGKSDARDGRADRRVEAGIFLHMREAVDAVAHHEPHGAGVIIRPDRLGAEFALGLRRSARRFRPAPRPRKSARTDRSPSARCGASDAAAGRDDECARRSARPWRRRRRRYRSAAWSRAPGRSCGRRSPRYRARRPTGNRADRWSGGCRSWHAGSCLDRYHQKPAVAEGICPASTPAKTAAGHASGAQIGAAIGVDGLPVDVARARARRGNAPLRRRLPAGPARR